MKFVSILMALSYFQLATSQTLEFEQPVRIKKENQSVFELIEVGQKVSLDNSKSLFVVTEKGLPLIFVSPTSKSSHFHVSASNFENILQEHLQPTLNSAINEIIKELRQAENLIQKKDYIQSLNIVTQLKNKYSNISSIYFMGGTIFYLLNNKTAAIEDLEKGLKLDPQNESASKLLSQLKGDRR